MFVNTLTNDSIERIYRALLLIDWTPGLLFTSLLDRNRPAVLRAVHSKQLTIAFEDKNSMFYMSRAEARALEVVLVKKNEF